MIKTLKTCGDPESLPIGASSITAGAAAAAYMGNFEVFTTTLCLIFMLLLQIFGNFLHRYVVSRAGWGAGLERYMTGEMARKEGGSARATLGIGVTASGLLTAMVGLTLLMMGGTWILAVAALIAIYIYFNTVCPRPLSRTPFSLLLTFVMFGPVAVMSTTYIEAIYQPSDPVAWHDLGPSFAASLVVGFYAVNVQLAYDMRSYDYDLHHGKRTLVTYIGQKAARNVIIISGLVAAAVATYATIIFPNVYGWVPITIFCIAAVVNAYVVCRLYAAPNFEIGLRWRHTLNWICLVAMVLFFIYALLWGHPDTRLIEIF